MGEIVIDFDSEKLKLPELGPHRLLVSRYTPVCLKAEPLLVKAIENKRITEMMDIDVNVFLELNGEISTFQERVARVMIKSVNCNCLDGEQNGFVIDPDSWMNGYLVHMGDKEDLFLGRPLFKDHGLVKLEEMFPGIYPGSYQSPKVAKKLLWNAIIWEQAISAYCVDKYPNYGKPPDRIRRQASV